MSRDSMTWWIYFGGTTAIIVGMGFIFKAGISATVTTLATNILYYFSPTLSNKIYTAYRRAEKWIKSLFGNSKGTFSFRLSVRKYFLQKHMCDIFRKNKFIPKCYLRF